MPTLSASAGVGGSTALGAGPIVGATPLAALVAGLTVGGPSVFALVADLGAGASTAVGAGSSLSASLDDDLSIGTTRDDSAPTISLSANAGGSVELAAVSIRSVPVSASTPGAAAPFILGAGMQADGIGASDVAGSSGPAEAVSDAIPPETSGADGSSGVTLAAVEGDPSEVSKGPATTSTPEDASAAAAFLEKGAAADGRSGVGTSHIRLVTISREPSGRTCRTYLQTIDVAGTTVSASAVVCKEPRGIWKVVDPAVLAAQTETKPQ
jgi:hypothetical protein